MTRRCSTGRPFWFTPWSWNAFLAISIPRVSMVIVALLLKRQALSLRGGRDVRPIRWKKKFAGMGVTDFRRLKELEEEHRRLMQLMADLSLDKTMVQAA